MSSTVRTCHKVILEGFEEVRAEREFPRKAAPQVACSRCGSATLQRSRIRWYERWLATLANRQPYRCGTCQHREWLKKWTTARAATELDSSPMAEGELDLTAIDFIDRAVAAADRPVEPLAWVALDASTAADHPEKPRQMFDNGLL